MLSVRSWVSELTPEQRCDTDSDFKLLRWLSLSVMMESRVSCHPLLDDAILSNCQALHHKVRERKEARMKRTLEMLKDGSSENTGYVLVSDSFIEQSAKVKDIAMTQTKMTFLL